MICYISLSDINQGSDATVSIVIRHARASDLSVSLTGMNGQNVGLTVAGRSGDDYLLQGRVDNAAAGDYLLSVADSNAGVSGSLRFFGVEQTEQR